MRAPWVDGEDTPEVQTSSVISPTSAHVSRVSYHHSTKRGELLLDKKEGSR